MNADDVADAFITLKQAGKIKHAGVSNFTARQFELWRENHPTEQCLLFEGRTKPEIFGAERRRVAIGADLPDRALREAGEVAWAFAEGAASVHRALIDIASSPP